MSNTNVISLYIQGKSKSEIAKELKISRGKVFRELHKESALKIIEKIEGLVVEGIIGLQGKALNVMSDLLESENENVKLRVSMYLLTSFTDKREYLKSVYGEGLDYQNEAMLNEGSYNNTLNLETINNEKNEE